MKIDHDECTSVEELSALFPELKWNNCFEACVPPEWRLALYKCLMGMTDVSREWGILVMVHQIKEKFGSPRFYYDTNIPTKDTVNAFVGSDAFWFDVNAKLDHLVFEFERNCERI